MRNTAAIWFKHPDASVKLFYRWGDTCNKEISNCNIHEVSFLHLQRMIAGVFPPLMQKRCTFWRQQLFLHDQTQSKSTQHLHKAKGISVTSAIGPLETQRQQAMTKLFVNFYLPSQLLTQIVVRRKILFSPSPPNKQKQAMKFSYSTDTQRLFKLTWCLH